MSHQLKKELSELRRRLAELRQVYDGNPVMLSRVKHLESELLRVETRFLLGKGRTVVALVGGTGSGKSSLFNALTETQLAEVSPVRPTTEEPIAALWPLIEDGRPACSRDLHATGFAANSGGRFVARNSGRLVANGDERGKETEGSPGEVRDKVRDAMSCDSMQSSAQGYAGSGRLGNLKSFSLDTDVTVDAAGADTGADAGVDTGVGADAGAGSGVGAATGAGVGAVAGAGVDTGAGATAIKVPISSNSQANTPMSEKGILDFLQIRPERRVQPAPHLLARQELAGVILLDMPDHDSVKLENARHLERIAPLCDVLAWVVDPQKYADPSAYVRHIGLRRESTLVVINHNDLLTRAELREVIENMRTSLDENGITEVKIITTSALLKEGVASIREEIERINAHNFAFLATRSRLASFNEEISRLVPPGVMEENPVLWETSKRRTLYSAFNAVKNDPSMLRAVREDFLQLACEGLDENWERYVRSVVIGADVTRRRALEAVRESKSEIREAAGVDTIVSKSHSRKLKQQEDTKATAVGSTTVSRGAVDPAVVGRAVAGPEATTSALTFWASTGCSEVSQSAERQMAQTQVASMGGLRSERNKSAGRVRYGDGESRNCTMPNTSPVASSEVENKKRLISKKSVFSSKNVLVTLLTSLLGALAVVLVSFLGVTVNGSGGLIGSFGNSFPASFGYGGVWGKVCLGLTAWVGFVFWIIAKESVDLLSSGKEAVTGVSSGDVRPGFVSSEEALPSKFVQCLAESWFVPLETVWAQRRWIRTGKCDNDSEAPR